MCSPEASPADALVSTDMIVESLEPLYPSSVLPSSVNPPMDEDTIGEMHLPQQVPDVYAVSEATHGIVKTESTCGSPTSSRFEDSRNFHNEKDGNTGRVRRSQQKHSGNLVGHHQTHDSHLPYSDADTYLKKMSTFNVSQDDLLDNSCAQALQKLRKGATRGDITYSIERIISDAELTEGVVDWTKTANMERLRDLCRFVRRLFWAFSDEEAGLHGPPPLTSRAHQLVSILFKNELVGFFFALLTVYALFGPDICAIAGYTAAYNTAIAVVNTVVLFLFFLEAALNSWVTKGYFCSGNFWIDIFATCTMIGDTWIAMEIVQSDATMAARGTRVAKIVRVGGRSTRMVRLLRVARAVQVLRLVPKLQRWLEKSTHDLALALFHKRLWHLFKCLDRHTGVLTEVDKHFLYTALHVEFPPRKDEEKGGLLFVSDMWGKLSQVSRTVMDTTTGVADNVKHAVTNVVLTTTARDGMNDDKDVLTYPNVVNQIMNQQIGKRAFQQCVSDIHCMKDSSLILDKSINRITLKVCLLVLALIIIIPLLERNIVDRSPAQILSSLDNSVKDLTTDVNGQQVIDTTSLCSLMRPTASWVERSALQVIVLDNRLYWDTRAGCRCCDPQQATVLPNKDAILDFADQRMLETGLESFLLRLDCLPDKECENDIRSIVVFVVEDEQQYIARMSIVYTSIVVFIMICLVVFFAVEIKRTANSNIFHPLWDLLDDMCALKCMEVVAGGNLTDEGPPSAASVAASSQNNMMNNLRGVRRMLAKCSSTQSHVSEEMVGLRAAFLHLRGAILSWGKYVPAILLKQLYEAGIEAQIGCTRTDVSVFFCDIENFKDLCSDQSPEQVLNILGAVLERVTQVIEDAGGTLLEFIGDEVMAVFNAPAKVPNHIKYAVTAAAEVLETTSEISFHPIVQCGVHRASVLAGNLGSPTRMKFGLMGDGVNLTARLKSLNTRYGTQLLVSDDALNFEGADELLVVRPIGNLVLKGRTYPTPVFEVLGKRANVVERVTQGAAKHEEAFRLFCNKSFEQARKLFIEAHSLLSRDGDGAGDKPSLHLRKLCDQYLADPPPESETWDGREYLTKKAW